MIMAKIPSIVIDTDVIVTALKSKLGTSYALLMLLGTGKYELHLSVPLILEYEKVILDPKLHLPFNRREKGEILDYICSNAKHHEIFYLWRPLLKDPGDDMVLELAITAGCKYIVTFNKKDFRGIEHFKVKVISPKELLRKIGVT